MADEQICCTLRINVDNHSVPVKSFKNLLFGKKKVLSLVRMTLRDTLPSACLLHVRFSFVVLDLKIQHRILKYNCGSIMRSTSHWKIQTVYQQTIMHIVLTVVCNVCYRISTYTNVIQCVYDSPARGNWFDFAQKTNRNPVAASAQKSTRTGTYEVGQLTELLQHLHHLDIVWLGYGTMCGSKRYSMFGNPMKTSILLRNQQRPTKTSCFEGHGHCAMKRSILN